MSNQEGSNCSKNKLNLDYDGNKPIIVGQLTQEIIDLLGLKIDPKDIIIWKDRIKYIEKHKDDFNNQDNYVRHVETMPEIVQNPDYVGVHPKGDSIQYIKKIDEIMLVAVRIKMKGKLVVRSCYPIPQTNLDNYIKSGTVKQINKGT